MTMFPHTITVYCDFEDPATFEVTSTITVLRGVLVDATKGVNVKESGLTSADSVIVYIPFDVEATDGISLFPKTYVTPKEYALAADKSELWTLDDEHGHFVKGEVIVENKDFEYINAAYDDVYRITKVDTKDFGSLQHFEVGGR